MNAQQVAERLIAARQTAAGGTTPDGARTPLEAYRDELATYTAALRTAPLETLEAVLDWYATEVALARDSVNEGQARRWRLTTKSYAPEGAGK